MPERRDIIILGGGLNGATLALALARHGVTSHIVDFGDRQAMLTPEFDGRTTAIASSSMAMFEAIGLADRLEGQGCPIEKIWVSDQLKPGALDFAAPSGDDGAFEPLGFMFENRHLRRALFDAIDAEERIHLHMPAQVATKTIGKAGVTVTLDSGDEITGALLVAAEGRRSPTRDEAGF